jgi:hypothetical protein
VYTKLKHRRREESLITQQGTNAKQTVEHEAAARRLGVVARAEDQGIEARAQAERQKLEAEAAAARQRILAAAKAEETRLEAQTAAEQDRVLGEAAAERKRVEGVAKADTVRVMGNAQAEATRAEGMAEADKLRAVGEANAAGEQLRLDAYKNLPPQAVLALAVQELAGQLTIDNLTITPDMLGSLLEKAAKLGLQRLERENQ